MSCVGCGDGGADDGGVYINVLNVSMVAIHSDAIVSVVVSASVRVP